MGVPDLVCFSQLRWDFVYQRPHHLLSRAARTRRVFYVEEPRPTARREAYMATRRTPEGVVVAMPHLPRITLDSAPPAVARLVGEMLVEHGIRRPVVWYSTPMAEPVGRDIDAACRVYDCMDELAAFKMASRRIREREARLLASVDLVFTGGRSIYEAKAALHPRVHAFPSAVDLDHFAGGRTPGPEPYDLAEIPRPRLCYVGVVDERLDMDLLSGVAAARAAWGVVVVGPVAKIPYRSLAQAPNIHYLGKKPYGSLPEYLGHSDVAIMPFALTAATRYISPTKTPEYLAAGLPVVSTSVPDVLRTYGEPGLVAIADGVDRFVAACDDALGEDAGRAAHRRRAADEVLATMSWDATWERMDRLITRAVARRAVEH
ncbi:MAG: glycosyltransferase, partial [Chloroflexota bacterium]|nr:glycosyltransferase [Chloroflexota bacterium]